MTNEVRLAELVAGLESAGVAVFVMGGHAVRFYGYNRDTNDFDRTVSRTPGPTCPPG